MAVDSKLGWFLSGPIDSGETNHACVVISGVPVNQTFDSKNNVLVKSLCEFWNVEFLSPTKEDATISSFPPRISFHNNRYSVSLPWKSDHPEIPNYLSLCESHLKCLFHILQSSPEMLLEYDRIIRDQLQAGIIENVEPDLTKGGAEADLNFLCTIYLIMGL